MRVAAGAIAKKWLRERYGVDDPRLPVAARPQRRFRSRAGTHVDANPFFVANATIVPELEAFMDKLRKSGDSVGARIKVVATGVPVGWGEPVYGKLDADLASAMMGINAVKGVEIGAGFAAVAQSGTEHSDEMTPQGFLSNNAGGILGGISTGQDVVVHDRGQADVDDPARPPLDRQGGQPGRSSNTHGRHDPCVGIRATPIAEAMMALVLMDHALRHRAQNADVQRGDAAHRGAGAAGGGREVRARRAPSTIPIRTKRS